MSGFKNTSTYYRSQRDNRLCRNILVPVWTIIAHTDIEKIRSIDLPQASRKALTHAKTYLFATEARTYAYEAMEDQHVQSDQQG